MRNIKVVISSAILLSLPLFPNPANAWVDTTHTYTTLSAGITVNNSTTDSSGNIYAIGTFTGTVDFEPQSGVTQKTSFGENDVFILKLDSSGDFLWIKTIGSSAHDAASSVAISSEGSVYIAGTIAGDADFDPGSGYDTKTATNQDGFVLKLDASGNYVWSKKFDVSSYDATGTAVAVDASGNVVAGGSFKGTLACDAGNGVPDLVASTSYTDNYLIKLDSSGNYIWAKSFTGNSGSDVLADIAIDSTNHVYATGNFQGTTDFDPAAGTSSGTTNKGANDGFVVKLNSNGDFSWVKTLGGTAADFGRTIQLDSLGNIFVFGEFKNTVDFNVDAGVESVTSKGDYDVFALKLDSSGGFSWARQFGGLGTEFNTSGTVDSNGNIYVSGYFTQTVNFNPLGTDESRTAVGSTDIYINKYNSAGNFEWNRSFGASGTDSAKTITALTGGKIVVLGYFNGTVDFDLGDGISQATAGSPSPFVLMFDASGSSLLIITKSAEQITKEAREAHEKAVREAQDVIKNELARGGVITVEQFAAADLRGVTVKNVDLINSEISKLPKSESGVISAVAKIVFKYEVAGRVEGKGTIFYSELAAAGLAPESSSYKTMIVRDLKKLSGSDLSTIAQIQSAIQVIEAKYKERKAKLSAVVERIATRSVK